MAIQERASRDANDAHDAAYALLQRPHSSTYQQYDNVSPRCSLSSHPSLRSVVACRASTTLTTTAPTSVPNHQSIPRTQSDAFPLRKHEHEREPQQRERVRDRHTIESEIARGGRHTVVEGREHVYG